MSGMKVLPRYRTWETGVGCAEHGDPTCLCDVVIQKAAPVLPTEHKFHNIALNELDDDTVSSRNCHQFFSVVLGLFELEQALRGMDVPVTRTSWQALPQSVRTALHHHARADSHWDIASMELDGLDISDTQLAKLKYDYQNVAGGIRRNRRKGPVKVRTKMDPQVELDKRAAHKRARLADPAEREKVNARKRAYRAAARGKRGRSWLEAKHTGPTFVPGTYALEGT
jgi:hypothetical protein